MHFSLTSNELPEKVMTGTLWFWDLRYVSFKQFCTMFFPSLNSPVLPVVLFRFLELQLVITYVFPAVSPFHFGDTFTETGFRVPTSMKTVY